MSMHFKAVFQFSKFTQSPESHPFYQDTIQHSEMPWADTGTETRSQPDPLNTLATL